MEHLNKLYSENYNTKHPHSSLGDIPPKEYKNRFEEEFFPETNIINGKILNPVMTHNV